VLAVIAAALVAVGAHADRVVAHKLVSDRHDAQLVNAWGLAASPTGPWWVANEARSSSTLYSANGRKQALTVSVPGGPTGVVYNGGPGFLVRSGGAVGPARFIYACEDGMIRGWSPTVPQGWSTDAVVAYDGGATAAVYRGIALARGRLYVTDFHNDRVLMFDSRWRPVVRGGAFHDPKIPEWYAPFGIAAFGDRVFVTYAFRAPVNGNDAPQGGYVDEFDLDGRLVARVRAMRELAEPWGLALAPRGFGGYGGHLLVANFGSERITAYARVRGGWAFRGRLPVRIPGVWGIAFGTGGMSGPRTTLFYAAGPHRWLDGSELDVHGAFGSIRLAAP
jgi:uncharacterized protein (TIGR03118 family)